MFFTFQHPADTRVPPSFPTRRSSDLSGNSGSTRLLARLESADFLVMADGSWSSGDSVLWSDAPGARMLARAFGIEIAALVDRSEERRVGKECRSRWSPEHEKNKEERQ